MSTNEYVRFYLLNSFFILASLGIISIGIMFLAFTISEIKDMFKEDKE